MSMHNLITWSPGVGRVLEEKASVVNASHVCEIHEPSVAGDELMLVTQDGKKHVKHSVCGIHA